MAFDAERLTSTEAPASAAREDGGIGTQTSSQTSIWIESPGKSLASMRTSEPKGAIWPATEISSPAMYPPEAKCRFS